MRDEKHECASTNHRGQSQCQQQPIQAVKKRGCLIIGLEHRQADGRGLAGCQFQGSAEKTLVAELNLLGIGNPRPGAKGMLTRQLRLLQGRKSAAHDTVTVIKSDLTGSNPAHLGRNPVVNLIADNQKTEQPVFRRGAKINWLQKYFVQVLPPEPPVFRTFLTQ